MWAIPAMSVPMGPNALPQQGELVGHVDTPERSNEPIYADAARAASGEKSSGKDPAQATSTPHALAAAVHSVRVRIAPTALLLQNTQARDQHEKVEQQVQTSLANILRELSYIPVECAKAMVEMLQRSSLKQETQAACMVFVNDRVSSTQGAC